MAKFVELSDYQAAAREKIGKMVYEYFAGGANDQVTMRENRVAFERIQLLPRVMIDVAKRDVSSTVLGMPLSMPLMVAPTAFQRMAHPDGELGTARAAAKLNVPMMVSTFSSIPLEAIAQASFEVNPAQCLWMQLYVYKDRGVTRNLVERAIAAGFKGVAVTVDAPTVGRRYADVRNNFYLPEGITVANFASGMDQLGMTVDESGLFAYANSLFDPSLTWQDIGWLKSISPLPLLVKGILRPDDAVKAVDSGVDGIIVSNHGGRQLDTAPATIDVIGDIADTLGDKIPLLLDGGVRRGTDILKAIALGAKAVMIGRPILWGLSVDGQTGVEHVLSIMRDEFDLAMMLCGCPTLADITRDLIHLYRTL